MFLWHTHTPYCCRQVSLKRTNFKIINILQGGRKQPRDQAFKKYTVIKTMLTVCVTIRTVEISLVRKITIPSSDVFSVKSVQKEILCFHLNRYINVSLAGHFHII